MRKKIKIKKMKREDREKNIHANLNIKQIPNLPRRHKQLTSDDWAEFSAGKVETEGNESEKREGKK